MPEISTRTLNPTASATDTAPAACTSDVVIQMNPLPPQHVTIPMDEHQVNQELQAIVHEVAKNVTDQNVRELATALDEMGVHSAEDLKKLMSTAQTRDAARSMAAALYVYSFSFGMSSALIAPAVATASPAAAAAVGLTYAAIANPTMQGAAARGGLAARYNPLTPPNDEHLSFSGRKGAAQVHDLPFDKFIPAFALSDTLSAAAFAPTEFFAAAGVRAAAGAVAAVATGREARAALEGIETHANRRTSNENGGYIKPQAWLDANDLEKTGAMIKTLKQSSPRAIAGYGLDAIKALRFVPSELAGKIRSPRTYANLIALSPAMLLSGLKSSVISEPAWKTFTAIASDVFLIFGWQQRNQLTRRISCGKFTEEGAKDTTTCCHQALATIPLTIPSSQLNSIERESAAQPAPTIPTISEHVSTVNETTTRL